MYWMSGNVDGMDPFGPPMTEEEIRRSVQRIYEKHRKAMDALAKL